MPLYKLLLLVQTNCLRALPSPLAGAVAAEAEEDINLLNYCCDHNFNDTKIKKPLRPQRGGGNIIHDDPSPPTEPRQMERAKLAATTTKASESRWQWLPEKFPLNLLTIFASHKLCYPGNTDAVSKKLTHKHTH